MIALGLVAAFALGWFARGYQLAREIAVQRQRWNARSPLARTGVDRQRIPVLFESPRDGEDTRS